MDNPSSETVTLTIDEIEEGKIMAILSIGGHPQFPSDQDCKVLTVEVFETLDQVQPWVEQMIREKPWESDLERIDPVGAC